MVWLGLAPILQGQNWQELNQNVLKFYQEGAYEQALQFAEQALTQAEKEFGKEHPNYGTSLNGLAGLYESMGQYEKALPMYLEALANTERSLGKEHADYGTSLDGLAGLYESMGQYEKALPLYLDVLANYERSLGKEHAYYGIGLNNLALLYESMGQYEKALPMYLEALANTERSLGKEHPDYGTTLNNLAGLYRSMGQYEKALPLFLEASENILSQLQGAFSFMSEKEKEQFLNTVANHFEGYHSFFSRYAGAKPAVGEHGYDIALATKGMILQSGIEARQALMNSGDSAALAKYEGWAVLRGILAKQYSLPLNERRKDIKTVEDAAEKAEAELSRLSAAFREQRSSTQARWQQIQEALQPGEVAIEFASFNYRNDKKWTDSTLYIALLLRKEDKHPHIVSLFEQKQLDSLLTKKGESDAAFVAALYRTIIFVEEAFIGYGKRLYELLWQPLEQFIAPGSTVYFAPSGSLHQLAFAAIPVGDNQLLSDRYQLQQVSTTARLLRREENTGSRPQNIVLFGGINYEAENEVLLAQARNIKVAGVLSRSLPDDLDRGNASWKYLPGTLQEVNRIVAIAQKANILHRIYAGNEALEEQVKALAGAKSPEVLHLSTHGFFFPNPKQEKPKTSQALEERSNSYQASDNPLQRSGLLFSGANRAWLGATLREGLEDGILTAYEISHLYLGNTRLVVLSACETGLGDILGSEGVFGLQRAFKQAGVEYLLMSLWKVPDEETAQFMEHFYTLWLSGKSIPESFKATQTYMRHQYPGQPYKWAAFVLLR